MAIFNTPTGVQVATSTNWIASNSVYDMLKPENDTTEVHPWGNQDFTGLIEMYGGKHAVSQIQYRHFEEDRIMETIIAAYTSGSTSSTADTVVYTIDSSDIMAGYPASVAPGFVATGTQVNLIPVRVDEILKFSNGSQGVVTTTTPSTSQFTVVATNGIALPGAGQTILLPILSFGISQGEGKTMPTSFNYREAVYTGTLEFMTDSHESTGRGMAEQTWVDYTFKGTTKASWWFKGQNSTYKRFRNYREMKYIAGERIVSGTAVNAYDSTLTRTEGLIPFAGSYNSLTPFNINTGLTLDDWQTIYSDSFDKNKGATEYGVWSAINNVKAIESFVRSEMKAGAITYAAFAGGEKQAVNFGFDSFKTLGYTSHLYTYQPFNDPTIFNGAGQIYPNISIFIPMDKAAFAIGDNKEKMMVPSMRINYLNQNGYNREWEEYLTGGANGIYTNRTNSIQINFSSDTGMEFFGANRFGILQGVNA